MNVDEGETYRIVVPICQGTITRYPAEASSGVTSA